MHIRSNHMQGRVLLPPLWQADEPSDPATRNKRERDVEHVRR